MATVTVAFVRSPVASVTVAPPSVCSGAAGPTVYRRGGRVRTHFPLALFPPSPVPGRAAGAVTAVALIIPRAAIFVALVAIAITGAWPGGCVAGPDVGRRPAR